MVEIRRSVGAMVQTIARLLAYFSFPLITGIIGKSPIFVEPSVWAALREFNCIIYSVNFNFDV